MSDFLEQQHPAQPLKREHDSSDDFEHLEHELQQHHHHPNNHHPQSLLDFSNPLGDFDINHHVSAAPPPPQLDNLLDNLLDTSIPVGNKIAECDLKPVPATPPPSADFDIRQPDFGSEDKHELEARLQEQLRDPKAATMAFMETEKMSNFGLDREFEAKTEDLNFDFGKKSPDDLFRQTVSDDEDNTEPTRSEPSVTPSHVVRPPADKMDSNLLDDEEMFMKDDYAPTKAGKEPPTTLYDLDKDDFMGEIKSSTLPEPEKSPELDFVKEEIMVSEATKEKPVKSDDQLWNVLEKSSNDKFVEKEMFDEPPTKPLPPLPKGAEQDMFEDFNRGYNKYEATNDFLSAESKSKGGLSGGETGDSEFESEPEPSPVKTLPRPAPPKPELGDAAERKVYQKPENRKLPSEHIFKDFSIDAWFNPERLNPKVAALIYWRDPKKSGILFGATLGVLLSLAYFSLISVVAYISLITLTCTVAFRIYKTILQAVQKTSDGHPFKEILDVDLSVPSERVHEIADILVSNVNAALCELRRLFLVEDIVDSLKFGILLWSLTYLGSWFNGMTLIIIGVVALFSLPKVYETNKTQIDQQLAVVQAKINEITAKVKAALPIGKKTEVTKED